MLISLIRYKNKKSKTIQVLASQQIIHGDFNEQNILCRQDAASGEDEIFSVIDFGDSQRNPLLYELGITIMYMMTKCTVVEPAQVPQYS